MSTVRSDNWKNRLKQRCTYSTNKIWLDAKVIHLKAELEDFNKYSVRWQQCFLVHVTLPVKSRRRCKISYFALIFRNVLDSKIPKSLLHSKFNFEIFTNQTHCQPYKIYFIKYIFYLTLPVPSLKTSYRSQAGSFDTPKIIF